MLKDDITAVFVCWVRPLAVVSTSLRSAQHSSAFVQVNMETHAGHHSQVLVAGEPQREHTHIFILQPQNGPKDCNATAASNSTSLLLIVHFPPPHFNLCPLSANF